MATIRKAKYLYSNGVYYEIGGEGGGAEFPDDYILVQDTEPTSTTNKIWIKETDTPVVIPTMEDIEDFVSFGEAQTLTDAEKAQARSNIGAEKPWTLVWTNASPTSSFAQQDISIDLSGYSSVWIRVNRHKNDSPDVQGQNYNIVYDAFCELGAGNSYAFCVFDATGAARITRRSFRASSSGVSAGAGDYFSSYGGGYSTNNEYMIPLYIFAR